MELKDTPNILLSIIVTILILASTMIALSSFKGSSGVYTTLNDLNQSFTVGNNTFVRFADAGEEAVTVTAVRYSNGTTLEAAKYTTRVETGEINVTTVDGTYYADYSYKAGTAYNISKSGQTTLTNMSSNLPTVGTVIGITLLIGLLVGMFMRYRNG